MDKSVIIKAAEGDVKSFRQIFDFYLPKMRPVCMRYCRTTHEADDILQEAFVKIFHNLKYFKFEGSFEGWIRKIVVNSALNAHKKNIKLEIFEPIDQLEDEGPDEEILPVLDDSEPDVLLKLLDQLPVGYKTVFNLYVLEDFSHKEIGEMLGISESSSRSQYSKAKKFVKKLIAGQRNEEKSSLIGRRDQID
ncbi:MAG: RNA polymerase sigma factor [Cytophagaceae bacterium]